MPNTVKRVSGLQITDDRGQVVEEVEFAGANSGVVFNTIAEAQAAIQSGDVKDGDVFYIKNDGTSGYPVFIGTSAQITTADNAGNIPAGMLIYCTDDSVNDITALQVGYDNTDSGLEADNIQDAVDELNSDLSQVKKWVTQEITKTTDTNGRFYLQVVPSNAKAVICNLVNNSWATCLTPFKINSTTWACRALKDLEMTSIAETDITVRVSWLID
jgi:hypothetical protein